MSWIYLSPHFDDAALSCGALIWEQARQDIAVEIWTICGGDAPTGPLTPLAEACHREWGIASAVEMLVLRRRENQKAVRRLGARLVNFDFPDCIYRRSSTGEPLYVDVFGLVNPLEEELAQEMAALLASRLLPDDTLVCPLGLGQHVDHILVRRAAEGLRRSLLYYADIPYLFRHAETLEPMTIGMKATLYSLPEEALVAWQEAASRYETQIDVLFESEAKMQEAFRMEWEVRQGIRLWDRGGAGE